MDERDYIALNKQHTEMSTEEQIKLALTHLNDARVNTSGLGAPINILKSLLEDLESKPEDNNCIGWLQARIPSLKESHNVYWLKQAMEGYKKDVKQIQIEPDFQKVLHETVFENMRDKPLKNRGKELDKEVSDIELGNLSSPSLMTDLILKKYEDSNEFHFHELDRKWIIECMNEYKDAHVEQREKEMINEFADILNGIRDNVLIINNLNHGK